MNTVLIAAFYHFTLFPDFKEKRSALLACMQRHAVRGSILLANEGVNGTIAGSESGVHSVLSHIRSDSRFEKMIHKESWADKNPFNRSKVRLKEEIVALGVAGIDPNEQVGEYIPAEKWNDVISDPEVIVIDTRNSYEFNLGTFDRAIDPKTENFRDFPQYVTKELDPKKHKKVAMFCTGGIRCEKATAYMLQQGFEKVMHLEGGILKYLETIPPEKSLWKGECFVFDNRVSVDHALQPGSYELCHACRMPISELDKQSTSFVKGISCPNCIDKKSEEDRLRFAERQRQIDSGDCGCYTID